jgi:hypothetical protein
MANDAGPEAKQWALAATAILTTLTRREPRHDLLGGAAKSAESEASARTILGNSWAVDGRDKLIGALEWLSTAGSGRDYQQQATAFGQAPPQQRQQDPALAFVNQFGAEIGNRGLQAWDLGRLLAVAGWGFLAGYCSEEEAWGAILSAGVKLRGAYGSWDEFGKHYRIGAIFADAASVPQVEAILSQLTSAPNSPWRTTPWSLDGGAPATVVAAPYGAVPATVVSGASATPPPVAAYGAPPPAYGVPPNAPGAPPAAYGANPGAASAPGGPQVIGSYGGVPVIAPPPGGGPPPPVGGAGGKKVLLIALVGGGAFLLLIVVLVGLFIHHRHEEAERERIHEVQQRAHEHDRRPVRR